MPEFRLTRYDPALRDANGRYLRDEWTFFAQVGRTFAAGPLTLAEYERVETAYIDGVQALLHGAGVHELVVRDAHPHDDAPLPVVDGARLAGAALRDAFRDVLRERWWCRFAGDDPGVFVHFGRDFYIYLGLGRVDDGARRQVGAAGLFLEPCISPYHPRAGDDGVADG